MAHVGRTLRVLVVEDESLVAMLIEDMLLDLGHQIESIAGRVDQAMIRAREAEIDLAIVDLNLNGERTDPVAEILQERGIPFVFATGYGNAGVRSEWQGVPVLQKPFPPRELERAIAQALQL